MADEAVGQFLFRGRHFPGGVNMLIGNLSQFRKPATNILAFGVKFLPLGNRVENAKVRGGICACTSRPLPAAIIGRRVAIY